MTIACLPPASDQNLLQELINLSGKNNHRFPIQILSIFTSSQIDNKKIILKEMKERQVEGAGSIAQANKKTIAEIYFKEQVRKPGLFFCLHRADEWNETEAFIRKVLQEYPNLKVLVYYTGGRMEQKPVAAHLLVTDRKDFNLFGKEKPVLRQWLEKQDFDLLLVFSRKENERCKKLTLAIKARLKAGWSMDSAEHTEDISLGSPNEKISYDTFYSELKKYFKQMNIKLLP